MVKVPPIRLLSGNTYNPWLIKKAEKSRILPFAALGIGAIMVVAGVIRDEHLVVLKKAVNICLECIGIG